MNTAVLSERALDYRKSAPDVDILTGRDWQKTPERGITISLEPLYNNPHFGHLVIEETDSRLLAQIVCRLPDELPIWIGNIFDRAGKLLALKEGWDTYDASTISPMAIASALRILLEIEATDLPIPALVPLANGGVQIEWHFKGKILEIEFQEDGSSTYFYLDRLEGRKEEEETRVGRLKEIVSGLLETQTARY